jgi:diacylglycerol kinase family enzyme
VGHAERSPLVQSTSAKSVKVRLNRKVLYELDGGDRERIKKFAVKVRPKAVTVCVPKLQAGGGENGAT